MIIPPRHRGAYPGDRERTLTTIVKVVSGDTPETLDKVATMYERIVKPGVYRCTSQRCCGRRALHWRGPVLPDAQGRDAGLPPAGDSGRAAH